MGSMLMIIPVIHRISRRNNRCVRLLKTTNKIAAMIPAR